MYLSRKQGWHLEHLLPLGVCGPYPGISIKKPLVKSCSDNRSARRAGSAGCAVQELPSPSDAGEAEGRAGIFELG